MDNRKEWLSAKEVANHPKMPFSARWLQKQRQRAAEGKTYDGPAWRSFGSRVFYHVSDIERYTENKLKA